MSFSGGDRHYWSVPRTDLCHRLVFTQRPWWEWFPLADLKKPTFCNWMTSTYSRSVEMSWMKSPDLIWWTTIANILQSSCSSTSGRQGNLVHKTFYFNKNINIQKNASSYGRCVDGVFAHSSFQRPQQQNYRQSALLKRLRSEVWAEYHRHPLQVAFYS